MDLMRAIEAWSQATQNKMELESNLLQLLRHPQTSAEQLKRSKELYRDVCNKYLDVKLLLQSEFPDRAASEPLPWNVRG